MYFKDTARVYDINLKDFTPPTNVNFATTYKTINKEYIDLLKKSELFMNDFLLIV